MINYNKLFDVAYSDTIPESVKDSILDSILDSIGEELNEDLQEEGSRCVGILETLAFSNLSSTTVNEIIDRAFEGLNENFINEVSDAFVNKAAKSALEQRKAQRFSSGSTPIGLKGVQREARIQHAQDVVKKTEAPKQSAMDRLKGAVGKVKSWAEGIRKSNNKPVGLSSFKSSNPSIEEIKKSDAEIRDHAVKMGTGDGSKTSNLKAQPAVSEPKVEPVATASRAKKTTGAKKTTTASKTTGAKKTTGKSSKKASTAASSIAANIKQAEEVKPAEEPVVPVKRGRRKKS